MNDFAIRTILYSEWIAEYHKRNGGIVAGQCGLATIEMVAAFPELVRVAGWANGREHYWCSVGEGGPIVDPTASQFGGAIPGFDSAPIDYSPWKPGDAVTVGRCMYCGESIYREIERLDDLTAHSEFCDDACYSAMAADLNARDLR